MPSRIRQIDPRTTPGATVGGAVAIGEELAYVITDFDGLDIQIKLGRNSAGDRVMKQWMRETNSSDVWHPTVEMVLEFQNYFKDTNSGLVPGMRDGDPPPPQG